jgi:hypothetical protein
MISKDEVIDKLLACDDIFYQGTFWKTFNISKVYLVNNSTERKIVYYFFFICLGKNQSINIEIKKK